MIYYNKSEWPFHHMNMFASSSTTKIHHTKITVVSENGLEIPATAAHTIPYGPWRMRILVLKKAALGPEELNKFLNHFYKIRSQSTDFKIFSEIRAYTCTEKNICKQIGSSLIN